MTLKEAAPDMELHISTQANNTNYKTANFWYNMGAKRIVGARELSLKEIKEMRSKIPDDMEIETFVHGAMCISYSGSVFSAIISAAETPIRELVHILADGNIILWKKQDRESICL